MSITSALYTGVSGLLNNGEAMNVIGNNIANVNTVGYKLGRTTFSDMLSQSIGDGSQIGKGVQLQTVQNIFSQGPTQSTENVTDLAIQGNSFFALKASITAAPVDQNEAFLSKAGVFHVDSTNTLVNPDGYQLLDTQGNPIVFPNAGATAFNKVLKIEPNGLITYLATDGITQYFYNATGAGIAAIPANAAAAQKVAVVSVPDTTGLNKVGGSLYQSTTASGVPAAAFDLLLGNAPNGVSEQVLSNTLEGSNVDMASEFVKMIVTQRAYSANSKTITTTDQMTQEVLGLVR